MKLKICQVAISYRVFPLFHPKLALSKGKKGYSQKFHEKYSQWDSSHGEGRISLSGKLSTEALLFISLWGIPNSTRLFQSFIWLPVILTLVICCRISFCTSLTRSSPVHSASSICCFQSMITMLSHMKIFCSLDFYESKRLYTVSIHWKKIYSNASYWLE